MSERREYPRVPHRCPVTITSATRVGTGWTVDLTPKGLLVEVDESLLVQGAVTIRFEGPSPLRGLRLRASVTRAHPGSDGRISLGLNLFVTPSAFTRLYRFAYGEVPTTMPWGASWLMTESLGQASP